MLCYNVNDPVITDIVPVVTEVFEKYKDADFVSPYGFFVDIDEIDFPELQVLKMKYPNKDNKLRFQIRHQTAVGIHRDKGVPPCLIFPVRGCNEETKTQWYDLIEGDINENQYMEFIDDSAKKEKIFEHAITEPCIFDPRVWHGVEQCRDRVIARWWTWE